MIVASQRTFYAEEPEPIPRCPIQALSQGMETIRLMSRGRRVHLTTAALSTLSSGERIAFLEVFSGKGLLTLGVRAHGLKALSGWDIASPMGDKKWDFTLAKDRWEAKELVSFLDPVIIHCAVPCTKLSRMSLKPGQKNYDQKACQDAIDMLDFSVELICQRTAALGAGSLENPKGSRCWEAESVLKFFGSDKDPKAGRFFCETKACSQGPVEDGDRFFFFNKKFKLAATYQEIQEVPVECDGTHVHDRARGQTKGDQGWKSKAKLSGMYSIEVWLADGGESLLKPCSVSLRKERGLG
jgi:hypothetical protein